MRAGSVSALADSITTFGLDDEIPEGSHYFDIFYTRYLCLPERKTLKVREQYGPIKSTMRPSEGRPPTFREMLTAQFEDPKAPQQIRDAAALVLCPMARPIVVRTEELTD